MTEYTLIIKGKPVQTGSLLTTIIEFERCIKAGWSVAYLPCAIETVTMYGISDRNNFYERTSNDGYWVFKIHEICDKGKSIRFGDITFKVMPITVRGKLVLNIGGEIMPVRSLNFRKFEIEA